MQIYYAKLSEFALLPIHISVEQDEIKGKSIGRNSLRRARVKPCDEGEIVQCSGVQCTPLHYTTLQYYM